MSMQYCRECDTQVDLDYNAEHFISEAESKTLAGRCSEMLTYEETKELV